MNIFILFYTSTIQNHICPTHLYNTQLTTTTQSKHHNTRTHAKLSPAVRAKAPKPHSPHP